VCRLERQHALERGARLGDPPAGAVGEAEPQPALEARLDVAVQHPGDQVVLKMYRDGKTFDKTVTLKSRQDEAVAVKEKGDNADDNENTQEETVSVNLANLGFTVKQMTPSEKKASSVENGIIVTEVKPYGEAFSQGLQTNDVILEADKQQINSTKDLKKAIDKRKAGDAILLRVKRGSSVSFVAVQIPKD